MPPMSYGGAAVYAPSEGVPAPKLLHTSFCLSVLCFSFDFVRCRPLSAFCAAPDGHLGEQSYLYPDQTGALYGSKKHLRTAFMYTHYRWWIFKLQVIHTDLHGFFAGLASRQMTLKLLLTGRASRTKKPHRTKLLPAPLQWPPPARTNIQKQHRPFADATFFRPPANAAAKIPKQTE